ncbi:MULTISPECIES: hypothetical protein [Microbacterium]|uniref:hypothetical protein n=1 Tax=Microbacterium TaxID=33882 RepID=UPI00277EEA03|nr:MULTISPECIES: hypothetical protein [Microbacterium]MDQ1083127.1 uncharacterized membrane protein (DUF2068 family) [Microbacterium sp. SORGH_AS_0344]MDQ1171601.1 uncharacterized membrane protein (DUF2068 family) [Microbacterium proteolyticum]
MPTTPAREPRTGGRPSRPASRGRRVDVRYRVAAWLVITQGAVMEMSAFFALPVLLLLRVEPGDVGEHVRFALPYFQDNLYLLMIMSGIFGVLRVLGGVGILRDRLWGLAVTAVMCGVTLALMIFLLPAGIFDGLLSGGALVLIAFAWFGSRTLSARTTTRASEPSASRGTENDRGNHGH